MWWQIKHQFQLAEFAESETKYETQIEMKTKNVPDRETNNYLFNTTQMKVHVMVQNQSYMKKEFDYVCYLGEIKKVILGIYYNLQKLPHKKACKAW